MTDNLNYGTMNWRKAVKKNQHKTYWVIATFIVLFLLLGLLIDFIWRYSEYTQIASRNHSVYNIAPLSIVKALLSFQITPYAMIISTIIALVWIVITFIAHDKIMLSGTTYHEINESSSDSLGKKIYNITEEMKIAANMNYMPKVFIVDATYMNAFASGYSEKSAMIAVTRPLAEHLNRDELQAVIAHELTHIRNQDIKLNLFTMVLSSMLLIMIDWLFYSLLFSGGNRDRDRDNKNSNNVMTIVFIVVMVLRFVLPILTGIMMLFLSRTREYMADAGAVELMRTNEPMAKALIKISQSSFTPESQNAYKNTKNENLRSASYIFEPVKSAIDGESRSDFFSTHPSLEKRLKSMGINK